MNNNPLYLKQLKKHAKAVKRIRESLKESEHTLHTSIRLYLEHGGESQREVARRCNVSPAFLHDVKMGRRAISDKIVNGILA